MELPGCQVVHGTVTPRDNALRRITEFNEAGPPLRDVVFPRRDSMTVCPIQSARYEGAIRDELRRGEALPFPPHPVNKMDKRGT